MHFSRKQHRADDADFSDALSFPFPSPFPLFLKFPDRKREVLKKKAPVALGRSRSFVEEGVGAGGGKKLTSIFGASS